MNVKGYCLLAFDIPEPNNKHYIVIASDEMPDGKVLILPISSIKKDKYHDSSCEFEVDEIKNEEGKNLLSKPSYIRYNEAREVSSAIILSKQIQHIYKYKCKISNDILHKIQEGAKQSDEFAEYFKKYFDYF